MKHIISRANPLFKHLRSLAKDTQAQRRNGQTLLDGPHLVSTYRDRVGLPEMLLISESGLEKAELSDLLAAHDKSETYLFSDSLFMEISGTNTPVGILSVIAIPAPDLPATDEDWVVLDAVQDAGNVGSILRSSAAAGVRNIILGKGCAGVWTPKVLRAGQGAHFGLNLNEQIDLSSLLKEYQGDIYATTLQNSVSLYELRQSGPIAWIFGNEGNGVSDEVIESSTLSVTIPIASATESLNVGAAAAVCLFETRRRREDEKA